MGGGRPDPGDGWIRARGTAIAADVLAAIGHVVLLIAFAD